MAFTGGAAAVVADVFNMMWDQAKSKTDVSLARIDQAIATTTPAPKINGGMQFALDNLPEAPNYPVLDPNEARQTYDTVFQQMSQFVPQTFDDFMAKFFPDDGVYSYLEQAAEWVVNATKNKGTGIDPSIEAQLWERGRARLAADSERLENEAMSTWANRGFPMPPGALTNQVNQIRLDASRKLAETSRDIAIKVADVEIDNAKFAVQQAVGMRSAAVNAAGDYIKTVMLGPQFALQRASSEADVQQKFINSLTAMYSTKLSVLDPLIRVGALNIDTAMKVGTTNLGAEVSMIEARVQAVMAAAKMIGDQAAAGLNGLNGSAGISGSDSSSV